MNRLRWLRGQLAACAEIAGNIRLGSNARSFLSPCCFGRADH